MHSASRSQSLKSFWQLLASCLLAIPLGMWTFTSHSLAATAIVDTDGFETNYALGVLQGQEGWVTSGQGGGSAVIQNGLVESGSKAVRVDRGANSDDRWAVPVGGQGFPSNRYVLVDWDMYVIGTGAASSVFGPFLGVDTYDDATGPKVLGALGVDATSGDVLYQDQGSGILLETGATVTLGGSLTPVEWNHFQIRLDFEMDQYQILLNGTPLLNEEVGFVDGPRSTFTDADIATFAAGFDSGSQSQTGIAYFDNFLIRDIARADFDIDGDVDDADLSTWEGAFGATNGADADQDGDSDGDDFLIWQRDFDQGAGPLTAPVSAVPEPSTLVFSCLLTLGFCSRRR